MAEQRYCERCKKTLKIDNFYTSKNFEKYPDDGKLNICKQCITAHVNNWDPETYLWILQEIDIPYIPDEWNKLLATYGKEREKLTGTTILGRYISKMKLKQWKDYRWKDNDFIQELALNKLEQAMKHQGYDAQEIAKVVNSNTFAMPQAPLDIPPPQVLEESTTEPEAADDYFDSLSPGTDETEEELTDEDRIYLRLKWGKTYKPAEWIQLEQLYSDMMESYDIQAAGDINTLKIVCKCSLKANQLLDLGDVEGAQKLTKMYESLMKAGKWTAAQIKSADNEAVDSIGEIVALCEREGFIPKYYHAGPQDYIDRVEEDLKKYTHDLITNESGLGDMMEMAVKQLIEEQERIAEAASKTEEDEVNQLFDYDSSSLLDDQDFADFHDFEDELSQEDEEYLADILAAGGDLSAIS